ncbi:MAG: phosphoribosylformylglycinamidine synthase subunit PurL, partial [FCB group bacterium]
MEKNNNKGLFSEVEVNINTAHEVGLTDDEYNEVQKILGRTPTYTELGVFGVMWSEHCSYKNSIKQLKTLPRSGGRLLVEAGAENAGLIDIGNGYAIAFKIESHNHPSAIEPFQGAATGVGGILRDIFSMGARPIASLNSLRFGELDSPRTKYLLKGVVGGIGHYGNSFGVPTVGGEIYFEDCYFDNPLINAMAVGIVKTDKIASATAEGDGNPVFIVGSSTGRDGIHGASLLASREFDEKTEDMRPTVQVGDPFAEKLLNEATIELIESGVVVGVQDMGAAGICCSTSEMSARGNSGMLVDLDKVPLREKGMSAYEIMLSESQERMLFIIQKGKEEIAEKICNKWDVPITQIGEVTLDGLIKVFRSGKQVCEIPANTLVLGGDAPQYDREALKPAYLHDIQTLDINNLKFSFEDVFYKLLSSPNIASKRWVYEQYDSQVRTNTMSIIGDAAVLRIKEIPGKGIAVCTDCNSKYTYLNPYQGALIAVAEAARNVVCVGAEPVAITNCLNFGNPYDPEVYWTFKEVIKGMGDACRKFNTPVTGGNVSFHNESRNRAIYPTPVIGMLGL